MDRYTVAANRLGATETRLRFADRSAEAHTLTWREVIALWKLEPLLCAFFSDSLSATPFEAFFWETPPLTTSELDLPFECVIVSAPGAAGGRSHTLRYATGRITRDVITLRSLGGDAELVVPCDAWKGALYAHLAVFLRTASVEQDARALALGRRDCGSTTRAR